MQHISKDRNGETVKRQVIKKIIQCYVDMGLGNALSMKVESGFIWQGDKKLDFYEQFKQNFDKETKRNIELKTEVVRKKSTEEIEKTIRNNLNLLKDNEIALIIPSPPPVAISTTPTPLPNWKQWWELYFKN